MNNNSLRVQLSAVFLGFLLLVLSSVAVTFWLVQTQQQDAAIINLAGRQRMLAQQMTRLALTDPNNPELAATITRFEQTLTALAEGGEVVDGNGRSFTLSPPTNPPVQSRLAAIATLWPAFQNHLQPPIDSAVLQTAFTTLLARLDEAVSVYEAQAQAKITRLRQAQFIFLIAAFLMLAWGYHLVHYQLLQPLSALGSAAQKIGAGNLDDPVPALPGVELSQLGQTVETMRGEIAAYQTSLEQQVAQRTQELTAAFEFSQEIVRKLEPERLLQSVTDRARDLLQGQAASICVLDEDGRSLELTAGSGAGRHHLGLRQSSDRGLALPVIHEQKTVAAAGGCANCGFLRHFPGTSCLAAPLQVGGRALGALCVVRPQRPYDADEARALTLLANAAAIALENTRLIAAGKQQAEEAASLAERERLAADLHDNLAQTLGAINLSLDQLVQDMAAGEDGPARRAAEMQTHLQRAYVQVRMALIGLREAPPEETEFMASVQSLVADFETQSGLSVRLLMAENSGGGLTAVTQKQALHIIREALTNSRRHAQATQVQIAIAQENGCVRLSIADDGIGFDPDRVNSQNHLGLTIMRARAARSQGQFTIQSTPGAGTRINVTLPTRPHTTRDQMETA